MLAPFSLGKIITCLSRVRSADEHALVAVANIFGVGKDEDFIGLAWPEKKAGGSSACKRDKVAFALVLKLNDLLNGILCFLHVDPKHAWKGQSHSCSLRLRNTSGRNRTG